MDSDKPSNASSNSGSGDDLIEEMAKLMGNSSPKAESAPSTGSEPDLSASRHEPEASSRAAPDVDLDDAPTEQQASEPVAPPHSSPAETVSADDTPGWLPKRQPSQAAPSSSIPDSLSGEPERREPSFSLRPAAEEPAAAPAPAPDTTTSNWKPAPAPQPEPASMDFGLKRETPRTPEPQSAPQPTQPSAPSGFDFGFGAKRPEPQPTQPQVDTPAPAEAPTPDAAEEIDPIAALIRDQMQAPKAEPAAPETDSSQQGDSFGVPPVFGLGGEPGKRSSSGSDALEDIENLIGNAVRVDLPQGAETQNEPPATPAPVPHPAVRPHQPRPAAPPPPQNPAVNVEAAEAAILAAMATNSSGQAAPQARQAEVPADAMPGFEGNEQVLTDDDQPRSGIRWGRILMPVVALLVLVALGLGGYMFLTATPPEGEAPVLVADSDPTKVTPEVDETEGAGDAIVFNEDPATDGSEEQLVSRDQSESTPDDAIRQIITADTTENGLANRRVRTVTVRPDGTIVRGDDLVAGSEALPVERPEVPALPDDAVTSPLADTEVAGLTFDEPASDPLTSLVESTPANLVAVNGDSVPFPAARPDDLSALRAAVPAQTTPVVVTQPQPAVTATPQPTVVQQEPAAVDLLGDLQGVTPTPPSGNAVPSVVDPPPQTVTAAAWVQLASQRDQAIANSEAGRLSRLYSSALGGREPVVQQADLADRGIWYRVLVPAGSLSEAQTICGQISSIGGDCFARAN